MGILNFKIFKNWEYWPSYMFYLPNVPYAAYLALRAKSLVFYSATNPAIKHSGNGSESKFDTIQFIPLEFKPTTVFIKKNENFEYIRQSISENKLNYPLIVKPDIGFRGLLVKRISSDNELIDYLNKNNSIDLILQEFIAYKNECGIFYHRLPNEAKGKITSITLKKYPTITGDGKSTLIELINSDKRVHKYINILKEQHLNNFNNVLKKNEEKILNQIGNHSKGTQFINGNHLIDVELENTIDEIFQQIPNWFYGRLDIKYNSFESLKKKKNFKILEINGIISEPTHIYDSTKNTYFEALKEIRKHWKLVYSISTLNHRLNNVKYDSTIDFLRSIRKIIKHTKQIDKQRLS